MPNPWPKAGGGLEVVLKNWQELAAGGQGAKAVAGTEKRFL